MRGAWYMRPSIKEAIAAKAEARRAVEAHPMCLSLRDEGRKVIVVFPYGVFGVYGVRVDNTAAGLRKALDKCEQAWKDSLL